MLPDYEMDSWEGCIVSMSDNNLKAVYENGCHGERSMELETVCNNGVIVKYPEFYVAEKCIRCPYYIEPKRS